MSPKFKLKALVIAPLAGAALVLVACSGDGEDRPTVDVIQGSPSAGGASTGSVSASVAIPAMGARVRGRSPARMDRSLATRSAAAAGPNVAS